MKIKGFCPICGYPDPEVGPDAFLRCTNETCRNPDAVGEILLDNETCHLVRILAHGEIVIKHPLRERLGDQLMACKIHGVPVWDIVEERMATLPLDPGTYRLTDESVVFKSHQGDPDYPGGPWGWEKVG